MSTSLPQSESLMARWKRWARTLKREVYVMYLALRDPRVPWGARVVAAAVVAYAFSPIDLIPDCIPILGYLDDLILLPLGIALARKMIPADVMADCRARADIAMAEGKPVNYTAATLIVIVWLAAAGVAALWLYRKLYHR